MDSDKHKILTAPPSYLYSQNFAYKTKDKSLLLGCNTI